MESEKIKVIICEPNKVAKIEEIENTLKAEQQIVGGYIEIFYPFADRVAIICNEEGKINGMPFNRVIKDGDGNIIDVIAGAFIIAGLTEDDFCSLSDEHLEKYFTMFKNPQHVYFDCGKICLAEYEPEM